ncbi:MAG: glycosyltransferase family 4 protein [Chloroflexota bacterium]
MSAAVEALAGLRVAYDARYVRDAYGGIARYAFCLLQALATAAPETTLLVYHDPSHPATRFDLAGLAGNANVSLRPLRVPLYSLREQALWPPRLRRDGADLFYSPYFALPLLARLPRVCTVHDLMFERWPAYARGRWVRYYYRPMLRLALSRAARVVAVSESTRVGLAAFYGTPAARVSVVPEAAAPGFRHPLPAAELAAVRARLALPERYVLAVGARRPHKNLGLAVRAFASIQAEVPQTLVVVGQATRRYPDEVAASLAVLPNARAREIGSVAEAELPALYALADALLMPSLDEGFGLPALEAMACGTPVVAGDRAALPEVVGDAAVLVDPTDGRAVAAALRAVLLDPALAAALRQRGLARATAFSWSRSAAAALAVFAEAVLPTRR